MPSFAKGKAWNKAPATFIQGQDVCGDHSGLPDLLGPTFRRDPLQLGLGMGRGKEVNDSRGRPVELDNCGFFGYIDRLQFYRLSFIKELCAQLRSRVLS